MNKIFTKEQKLLHHLILHSHDVPSALGLFDGMTGITLVLAHYARVRKMPLVDNVADYLMEQITDNMTKLDAWDFGSGMAGIGWSIEYLIQNGYMKGCGVSLTREMDERIMSVDIRRLNDCSLEKGIAGLYNYVLAHVQGAILQGQTAFDRQYLSDWKQLLQSRQEEVPQKDTWCRMERMLDEALKGRAPYKLDLLPFIKPMRRVPMELLGLHEGLAGYMELQLQQAEKGAQQ